MRYAQKCCNSRESISWVLPPGKVDRGSPNEMPREGKASPYGETRDDEASHNDETHNPYGPWKTYARDELSQEDGHDDTTARAAPSCEPDCQRPSPLEPVPQHGYGWAVSGEDLSEWM